MANLARDAWKAALRPNTRMLFIETPSNPLLKIVDLRAVAALCRARGLISVVDNTFASPFFQRPLGFGIDRLWRAKSWDRFAIPKPLAQVRCVIGEDALELAQEHCRLPLGHARVSAQCEVLVG